MYIHIVDSMYSPVESARAPQSGDTMKVTAGVIAPKIPICASTYKTLIN